MGSLVILIRESKRLVIPGIVASLISGACNTLLIYLIHARLSVSNPSGGPTIWHFVGVCLLMFTSQIVSDLLLLNFGQRTVLNWRVRLSRRILSTPLRQLEQVGLHRLMAALTSDVNTIANNIALLPPLCYQITILVGCFIYMGLLSWQLCLATLACLGLGIFSYQLPLVRAMRYLRLARKEENALFGDLKALTEGAKELKIYRQQRSAFLADMLEPVSQRLMRYNVLGSVIFRATSNWGNLVYMMMIAAVIFIVPAYVQIDATILSGYTFTLLYMLLPLLNVMNILPGLSAATIAIQNIEKLRLSLVSDPVKNAPTERKEIHHSWKQLELQRVTYTYYREEANSSFLLGPIDLSFHPGELVFLVGGNGSGKTTLAKLITGLYSAESGEVHLDGQLITEDNQDDYRQLFSVVFADFFLFNRLLGMQDPELDARASNYLTKLQLQHKVQVVDGMLSTTDLSQGQRKRLALLTAYLEDRPFYVFDEWAADQDPLFRDLFYTQFLPELKDRGKTVLVITHDDRYHYIADRIIKLDYGQITADIANNMEDPVPAA